MNFASSSKSYIDLPCERCQSPRIISEPKDEIQETISGKITIKVSQIICTNDECQGEFDKNRGIEMEKIQQRKQLKEEQEKIRKENIAKAVLNRKK